MTTAPNLPPLPDEDGYILITIAGRSVEVNGYRNSTMEAYALTAYQAGKNAGLVEGGRAFQIADQAMLDLVLCHGIPDESVSQGSTGTVGLVDQGSCEVATLEEADPAVQEAYEWLHSRGLAEIISGPDGEAIYLKQVEL